ncbi:unnamed protein product [Closterium sp. Naga37s-1]|nr:unnamed protein product [Closterium sp. Naga37s-1]
MGLNRTVRLFSQIYFVHLRSSSPTHPTGTISQRKQQHCVALRRSICVGDSGPSVTISKRCAVYRSRSSRTKSHAATALGIFTTKLPNRPLGRIIMKLPRPALLLLLLLVSVALLPLFASSRTLPPKQQPTGGEIPPAKGGNTTTPLRHRRHGANGTAAAGNRTKGGHPNKGHHRGNGTAAGGPSPKPPTNGNVKNGNAPSGQKNGGAQPNKNGGGGGGAQTNKNGGAQTNKNGGAQTNKNGGAQTNKNGGAQTSKNGGGGGGGANKPRRPKQIAEEDCSSKTSWPEVVGMTGEKARDYILTSMPECNWDVRIIPNRGFATMDYRTNRVRIFVDKDGIVRVPPRIG